MFKFLRNRWEYVKSWFKDRQDLVNVIHKLERDLDSVEYKYLDEIRAVKRELTGKVSQERVAEILKIAPVSELPTQLSPDGYRLYLEEAEQLYKLRPWKDIIKKFQKDQVDFIIQKSDGGDIGQLQIMISRGGILFADQAETALNKLHVEWMAIRTGNKELSDQEKYSIFL